MITLLRTELLKLRTTRAPALLLLAGPLIAAGGVSGIVASRSEAMADPAIVSGALAHVGLSAVCSLALGILLMAGEYRHHTIEDTYLTTPRRTEVVLAKLAAGGLVGLLAGALSTAATLAAIRIWWSIKDVPLVLDDLWGIVVGCILWNGLYAMIGVALGALLRNLAAAVSIALVWIAVVETIVAQLVGDSLAQWLPNAAAFALGGVSQLADHLSPVGGALTLLAWTALFALVAASASVRRDVT